MSLEKVLKIIERKISINERLNETDLLAILNEYIRFYNLECFIKNVRFVNHRSFNYGAFYNQDNFTLVFVMNKIYENAITNYNFVSKKTKVNFNNFYNFFLLTSLFHELKHVIQYKKVFLEEDDNYLKIYEIDEILREKAGNNRELYIKYHDLFPCEREANVFSISETLKYFISLKIGLISKEELKYYQMYFINVLLSDYKEGLIKVNNPFERLLKIGKSAFGYYEMIEKIYLVLYSRLSFGLPINSKEYNQILELYYLIKNDKLSPTSDIKKIIVKQG